MNNSQGHGKKESKFKINIPQTVVEHFYFKLYASLSLSKCFWNNLPLGFSSMALYLFILFCIFTI